MWVGEQSNQILVWQKNNLSFRDESTPKTKYLDVYEFIDKSKSHWQP